MQQEAKAPGGWFFPLTDLQALSISAGDRGMEAAWFFLCAVALCKAEVASLVPVYLGADAQLNCSQDLNDVYWYMQLQDQRRMVILRTFLKSEDNAEYFNYNLNTKYFAQVGNRLVVKNMTKDDYRVYYCAVKKENTPAFKMAYRLVPAGQTANMSEQQGEDTGTCDPNHTVLFGSISLNILLAMVLAVCASIALCRKRPSSRTNDLSPLTPASPPNVPEYEEIQLILQPSYRQINTIYCEANMPDSEAPPPLR